MSTTPEDQSRVSALYTTRAASYHRFVRVFGYSAGLRAVVAEGDFLHSDMKVLDAGCGSGLLTQACYSIARERELAGVHFHGFDLTPHMLDRFRAWIAEHRIRGIELAEADVLRLETLPCGWTGYDLVVTASMLEYLPRDRVAEALRNLRARLKPGGSVLLFISRRNLLTRLLIRKWWNAHVYDRGEVAAMLEGAGFTQVRFKCFPGRHFHLNLWGHVIQAACTPRRNQRRRSATIARYVDC